MRALVLTGLIALSLAAPAAAQTGVVSGKVTDPQSDMVPQDVHSWNDLKSFELTYDADRGVVRGELQTYGGVYAYPWFTFYADLGQTQPGGACDANADGSLLTSFYTPDDGGGPPDPPHAQVVGGPRIDGSLSYVYGSGDFDTQIYRFEDPRLVGRTFDCVKNIELRSVYGTIDAGASFCMGPTGQITCPVAPAPAAPTQPSAPTPMPTATAPPGSVVASSGSPAAADLIPPTLTLSGPTSQRIDRGGALAVSAACGAEPCTVTGRGRISVAGAAVYSLTTAKASVPAGGQAKLRLKLPRRALAPVRLALRSGRHAVRVRLTVTAVDAAGNRTTRTRTIRARR